MLTAEQSDLIRGALGLRYGTRKSYRNRFLAGADDVPKWEAMVSEGYAERGDKTEIGVWFFVLPKGARAVLKRGETLCREDFPDKRT